MFQLQFPDVYMYVVNNVEQGNSAVNPLISKPPYFAHLCSSRVSIADRRRSKTYTSF